MKCLLSSLLILWLVVATTTARAQESVTLQPPNLNYSSFDKYETDTIPSDFNLRFKTPDEKNDFKYLRTYLSEKESLLVRLKNSITYLPRIFPNTLSDAEEIRNNLKELIFRNQDKKDPIEIITSDITNNFRLGSFPFTANQTDSKGTIYMTTGQLKPLLKQTDDYISTINQNKNKEKILNKNISSVEQDINDCRKQIDVALAPEYKQQEFRTQISLYFSVLIALVLISFFFIVYKNATNNLSVVLLSENGLQFVTVFVLIIAVILFGILSILHSSELAAILAGISGYILGRGSQQNNKGDTPPQAPPPAQAPQQGE